MCRFQILEEVRETNEPNAWVLCLQYGRYFYDDGAVQEGYRFIWRRPNGSLQAARGQARIPSLARMQALMDQARQAGWGDRDGDA